MQVTLLWGCAIVRSRRDSDPSFGNPSPSEDGMAPLPNCLKVETFHYRRIVAVVDAYHANDL